MPPFQLPPREDPMEPQEGEVVDLPPEPEPELEDAPDGGLYASFDTPETGGGGFFDNLVEILEQRELDDIVLELLEKIEQDKEARKDSDEQQADALRRTGFANDAPGGADFTG